MLERVNEIILELYKFCHLAYSQHSTVQFGGFSLSSQQCPQQHDRWEVCSSVWLFSQSCVLFVPLIVGFMDDVTLGGPKSNVSTDVGLFRIEGAKLSLNPNVSKY